MKYLRIREINLKVNEMFEIRKKALGRQTERQFPLSLYCVCSERRPPAR
jgi:hypothetical protein